MMPKGEKISVSTIVVDVSFIIFIWRLRKIENVSVKRIEYKIYSNTGDC